MANQNLSLLGGLRSRLLISLVLAVAAAGAAAAALTSEQIKEAVDVELRRRSMVVTRALATNIDVALAMQMGAPQAMADKVLAEIVDSDRDLVYIVAINAAGKVVGWAPHGKAAAALGLSSREGRERIQALHLQAGVGDNEDDTFIRLKGRLEMRSATEEIGILPELEDPGAAKEAVHGTALIGLSAAVKERGVKRFLDIVFMTVAICGVVVCTIVWFYFRGIFNRLNRLKAYAAGLAEGDLTQPVPERSGDEFGDLAVALSLVTESLGATIKDARTAVLALDEVSSEVQKASESIAANAGRQGLSVRQTMSAMLVMSDSSDGVEQQIGETSRLVEVSINRLRDIAHALDRVSSSVDQLSGSVGKTQQHLESNVSSLSEVDDSVDRLNRAAESTASAATQISTSTRSVERSASEASNISRDAAEKAETGVQAVKSTQDGIQRIRIFANEAVQSIRSLSEQVASIEHILKVINDIARQTQLVSLNASIIAAQAGEHGRGFLVVADEIKALSAKTANFTSEIADVTGRVLEMSGRAIDVVERGADIVDNGVERSEHADRILQEILNAAARTGHLVRSIAGAMTEQTRGASQVDQAMQEVHGIAVDVRGIVAKQKKESMELETAIAQTRAMMGQSIATVQRQASQVETALHAVSSIFDQIHHISAMNQEQVRAQEGVHDAFQILEKLSLHNRASADDLSKAVEKATSHTKALLERISVFRV